MRRIAVTLVLLAAVLAACWPRAHSATVDLGDGARLTMTLRAMPGLHSDWHRRLVIETPGGTVRQDLMADTGWWRGSTLYRHASGTYVLHEGQAGCIVLTALSPRAASATPITCARSQGTMRTGGGVPPGAPPSRFHDDLTYLGHFAETPGGPLAIRFLPYDALAEPDLPDIL